MSAALNRTFTKEDEPKETLNRTFTKENEE
jgi:hypothetical protein